MRKERGITLISLVITIIVMLILAGVTINLTLGENGIFTTAKTAKEKSQIGEYLDKIEIARAGVSINNMGEVTLDNLINKIYEEKVVPNNSIIKLDDERAKITTKEGYVFIITANKAEYVGIGEQVETPPDLQKGDIEFKLTPNNWTNGKVKVEIKKNIEKEYTLKYSYNCTKWEKYEKELEIEENKIIYACLENVLGEKSSIASYAITQIDKTAPTVPTITYNSGSNACSWQNNINISLLSTDGESGIAYYEIDYNGDGIADTTTEANYVPENGHHSCNNRFRAVDNVGLKSEWSSEIHIHQDTEAPANVNWWYGTYNTSIIQLYIQATDNVGISKVQVPTATEKGGKVNWIWGDAVWDESANAYRADIYPSTWGHYGTRYFTDIYVYDNAGNGGYYTQTYVDIPEKAIISGNALLNSASIRLVSEYCNYGAYDGGATSVSGSKIVISMSDYYCASRYLDTKWIFDGVSFVAQGQQVLITNTYYNAQVAESSEYDHSANKADLYIYNLSTGGKTKLGSIKSNGTKTFNLPNDGQAYTFYIHFQIWAAKSYATNTSRLSISSLTFN